MEVLAVNSARVALCLALIVGAVPLSSPAAAGPSLDSKIGNTAPYLMKDRAAEIALARTGGPPSISAKASVWILGPHGYEKAVDGTNGWVCFNEHSFDAFYNDSEFWLPENRSPNCFNPPAVATELPRIVARSQWVMAGMSIREMMAKQKTAVEDGSFKQAGAGAFSLMMSKKGYLNHAHGPWHPHVMLFMPVAQLANWGANLDGSPNLSQDNGPYESALVFIPVKRWSDGSLDTPAMSMGNQH